MARQESHMIQEGYQQGDVLAKRIVKLPEGAKPVKRTERGIVLAEGEATGHAHCITEESATLYEHAGKLFLKIDEPVIVRHEEHKEQTWAPGVYEIDRVREKDMLEGFTRRVAD